MSDLRTPSCSPPLFYNTSTYSARRTHLFFVDGGTFCFAFFASLLATVRRRARLSLVMQGFHALYFGCSCRPSLLGFFLVLEAWFQCSTVRLQPLFSLLSIDKGLETKTRGFLAIMATPKVLFNFPRLWYVKSYSTS